MTRSGLTAPEPDDPDSGQRRSLDHVPSPRPVRTDRGGNRPSTDTPSLQSDLLPSQLKEKEGGCSSSLPAMKSDLFEAIKQKAQALSGRVGLVIGTPADLRFFGADVSFPAASVIKLTLLWELFRQAEKGILCLADRVRLEEEDRVGGFGILRDLRPGLELTLEDLATLMITLSDNVATNLLIDRLTLQSVNDEIALMGLSRTRLARKMMDLRAKERGLENVTTPGDMASLLVAILNGPGLSPQSRKRMMSIMERQQCNNKLPRHMSGGRVFAHKTGDLPGTEHDVGILPSREGALIVVVMTADLGDNEEGIRFHNEVGLLLDRAYPTFQPQR